MLQGTETILLVEDNEAVRLSTLNMLERLGYKVISCEGGEVALTALATHWNEIDLVLTDIVMPGMNGVELGELLREHYPDVEILYCSGYIEDTFVRHKVTTDSSRFLGKPFGLRQLGTKLRGLLDPKRDARAAVVKSESR